MVRFLSPADVKGTATLTMEHTGKEDDLWIYLPALEKVRRLVASNKKDAFVGTDFSYGDIIGHKVDDWTHELTGEEVVDGHPCYVVTSVPRSDSVRSDTGYGKRVQWIRKDNFVGIKGEFFDETGKPLKTYTAHDVQLVDKADGKWQAMHAEMANLKTGHRTVIRVADFKTNQGVKDDVFTTRTLQSEL
jgi:outer membrane lipoprotein-sorting protein